jgi:hypothetical protein
MKSAVISLGLRIEHELMIIELAPNTVYLRDVRLQICLIQYCMPKWNCGGLARERPWFHNVSSHAEWLWSVPFLTRGKPLELWRPA